MQAINILTMQKPGDLYLLSAERQIQKRPIVSFKGRLISCTARLAVLLLRIAACVVTIFGSLGRFLAGMCRRKADRLVAKYVNYIDIRCLPPLPLLAPARNEPKPDVVRDAKHNAAAYSLQQRFLAAQGNLQKPFDAKIEAELQNGDFKGFGEDGICFGASLCFLHSVLKACCASEEHLQTLAQKCADGFPAEAAGMQMLYDKLNHLRWKPGIKKQRIVDLVGKGDRKEWLKDLEVKIAERLCLGRLIGLKLNDLAVQDFLSFGYDAATSRRFDELPKGVYQLGILFKKGSHAMAYLNLDFGSYLFDPNRGLMKCDPKKPAMDLVNFLLKTYPGVSCFVQDGIGAHMLQVYPYELAID